MPDIDSALINVNGELCGPADARVSVYDRSYLYGDSLYEVARSYGGRLYHVEEHLERLYKSAELARLTITRSREELRREIARTHEAWSRLPGNRSSEAYCRLVLSRGEGRIGFGLNNLLTPSLYTIIVQKLEPPSSAQFAEGFALKVVERLRNDPRALSPAMKSGNYLNSLLAYLEAVPEGFDDALLANAEGHLTEGTTFNIFYIKRGILVTPPLEIGILDGITRRQVIDLAREQGVRVREVRFPRERLYEADEVFLSSSIKEVFPVTRVDHQAIHGGKPGPLTQQLHQAFRKTVGNPVP